MGEHHSLAENRATQWKEPGPLIDLIGLDCYMKKIRLLSSLSHCIPGPFLSLAFST